MSERFDIEEIQASKTEKFLAVVLAVFCLIGGIWAYQKIDDKVAERISLDAPVSAADEAAIERRIAAEERVGVLRDRARRAQRDVEFTREEYRTALDEGRRAPRLQRAYRRAQATFATTERQRRAAETQLQRVGPAADAAEGAAWPSSSAGRTAASCTPSSSGSSWWSCSSRPRSCS